MITASNLDPKGNRFWKVITEPTVEPITVTEVKEYARIDGSDEDSFLESAITSVRLATEEYLGRALIQQTIRLVMDEYNERDLPLPRPPLISISSIQTIDEDDTTTDFDSDKYYAIVEAIPGRVVIKNTKSLPSNTTRFSGGYRVSFLAGYGTTASTVPQAIRDAMKMWTTSYYEDRHLDPKNPPPDIKLMLNRFKVHNL